MCRLCYSLRFWCEFGFGVCVVLLLTLWKFADLRCFACLLSGAVVVVDVLWSFVVVFGLLRI